MHNSLQWHSYCSKWLHRGMHVTLKYLLVSVHTMKHNQITSFKTSNMVQRHYMASLTVKVGLLHDLYGGLAYR